MGVLKEVDSVSDLERSEVRVLDERSMEDLEEELLKNKELRIDKNVVLKKLEDSSGLFTMYCKKCRSYSCEHVKSAIISNDELKVIQEYLINLHLNNLAGDLLRCLEKHSHKAQAFIINVRPIILNVKNKNIVLALDSTHDKVFYKYCKKCKSDNCEHVKTSVLTQNDLLGMQMTLLDSYYEFFSEALEECKGMKEE